MENIEYIDKVLNNAIKKFGNDYQLNVAIEEMSELIKEICKNKRDFENDDKILEEMADVYIMLYQLQIIFNIEDDNLNDMILRKVKRLEERIKNDFNL